MKTFKIQSKDNRWSERVAVPEWMVQTNGGNVDSFVVLRAIALKKNPRDWMAEHMKGETIKEFWESVKIQYEESLEEGDN